MVATDVVYVLYDRDGAGAITTLEVHASKDSAAAAVEALEMLDCCDVHVTEVQVKGGVAATKKRKAKAAPKAKADTTQTSKSADFVDPEDDGATELESDEVVPEETPKAKKPSPKAEAAKAARKTIPDGKPNVLKGMKLLFTGTMSMDRATSEAAAKRYGATTVKKLEETDYIILGKNPGPTKLQEIEDKDLDTITEAEFLEMLQAGVPQEKRYRMAAKVKAEAAAEAARIAAGIDAAAGEPAKKKQKK